MASNGAGIVVCRVCEKQYANYTCPRCNLRYCSLPCYKSHSTRCTESFMRENVISEMQNVAVSSESKRKMMEALKRAHDQEAAEPIDDEDGPDESVLSERTLQKLATDGDLSISDLSPEEMKAFQRAVAAGELSHLIKPWEPWWLTPSAKLISLTRQGTKLVKLVDDDHNDENSTTELPSPPMDPLPALSDILKAQPSPSLPVHLVEILYSYCFILRLYNGDWQASALDAAVDAMAVSKVLSQAWSPENVTVVIASCLETICCSPAFKQAGGYNLGVLLCGDVVTILTIGKGALVCALADFQRLFEAAIREMRSGARSGKQNRAQLQGASKKVFFMTCWVNETAALLPLAALVEAEQQRLSSVRSAGDGVKIPGAAAASPKRPGVVIQEIS